jgi:hypothetical protein
VNDLFETDFPGEHFDFTFVLRYSFAHGAGAAFFVVGGLDQVGGIALVDEFGAEAGAEEGNVVGVGLYGCEDFALVRFVFVVAALFYCYFAYGGV